MKVTGTKRWARFGWAVHLLIDRSTILADRCVPRVRCLAWTALRFHTGTIILGDSHYSSQLTFSTAGTKQAKLPLGTSNLSDSLHELARGEINWKTRSNWKRVQLAQCGNSWWVCHTFIEHFLDQCRNNALEDKWSGSEQWHRIGFVRAIDVFHKFCLRALTTQWVESNIKVKTSSAANVRSLMDWPSPQSACRRLYDLHSLTQRADTCQSLWANLAMRVLRWALLLLSIRSATNLPLAIDTTWTQ